MSFKAAIFDMDGVVVNTVLIHFHAWKKMFEEYGYDFDFEEYKEKVDGIPRQDGARAILTELNEKEIEAAAQKKQGYFLDEIERVEVPIYPTTIQFIEEIRRHKIKVAVISASKNVRRIIERIDLMDSVEAMVAGDDVIKGKPDPEMFLLAAKKLGTRPSESIVFEDAVLGVEAAKRAKMRCVGVDRYGEPDRLKHADMVIDDLADVTYSEILALF
jgi:beta-phosphoglucomutase